MRAGICLMPLLPLRSKPDERSEMVTQILFGELFEILEETDSWSLVRNQSDNYIGWCTTKMLQVLPFQAFDRLKSSKPTFTRNMISPCVRENEDEPDLFIPAGSRLYDFDKVSGSFQVFRSKQADVERFEEEIWRIEPGFYKETFVSNSSLPSEEILLFAKQFTNAPYLWGGKSILGIDCSGLVQLTFSISGFDLPRDACHQVQIGEHVPYLSGARAADLAFFANADGKVVHVGILMDECHIIHASGFVHTDRIDNHGIFNETLGKYTHTLYAIRRLLPS